MEAAGHALHITDHHKSVPELLQIFHVGTECRKEWKQRSKLPPKPSELGPIADMNFMSTATRAKLTMHPKVAVCSPVAVSEDVPDSNHNINIVNGQLVWLLAHHLETTSHCVWARSVVRKFIVDVKVRLN